MLNVLREKLHKYKKWEPLVFFAGGFIFDASLLHRIDNPLMLVHQAVYLSLSAFLIAWDLYTPDEKASPHRVLAKVWPYREAALHFMLGTLLNVYTIFYFKSGSFTSSLSFLCLLGLLLFLNEARPLKVPKHFLRNALFSLCLISYLNIVVSILVGSTGSGVFTLALVVAYTFHELYVRLIHKKLPNISAAKHIRVPFLTIALIYSLLYAFKVLPPVPLSVKSMGIYREVTKQGDSYHLGFEHESWKFWKNGDQDFLARPGDKIFCFAQVFSPTRFKDQLFVRWSYKDPRVGWQSWDAIPMNIVGGREEGYRGYTVKTNYQPGDWRVAIETSDGREVGRISLTIVATNLPQPTVLHYDTR